MASVQSQTPCCLCSAGGRGQPPAPLSNGGVLAFTLHFQQMQLRPSQGEAHGWNLGRKKKDLLVLQIAFFPLLFFPLVHVSDLNSIGFPANVSEPGVKISHQSLGVLDNYVVITSLLFSQIKTITAIPLLFEAWETCLLVCSRQLRTFSKISYM